VGLTLIPRMVAETALVLPAEYLDEVVAKLAPESVFHPVQPDDELPGSINREYRRWLSHLTDKTSKFERYFDVLNAAPPKSREIDLRVEGWIEAVEEVEAKYGELEKAFDDGVRFIIEAEARIGELVKLKEFYSKLSFINLDIPKTTELSILSVVVGFIPSEYLDNIAVFIEEKGCVLAYDETGENESIVMIACPYELKDELSKLLSDYEFQPLRMPEGMPGNPSELTSFLDEKINSILKEAEEKRNELLSMLRDAGEYYHILLALREAFRLLANAKLTERHVVIQGYVDKSDIGKLEKALKEATGGSFILDVIRLLRRAEDKKPPSRIVLPRILQPFHKIVRMYGEPDPDEVVPTIFLAITMPLIFGLMFPDWGHGLLVVLVAYWFYKKAKTEDSKLTWILVIILGAASMVTGFLAGEFFGPMTRFAEFWTKLGFSHPPLATPLYAIEKNNSVMLQQLVRFALTIPLVVAGIILILGTFLGVVNSIIKREYGDLLATKLPKFLLFTIATLPFLVYMDAYKGGGVIRDATLGGMHTTFGKVVGIIGIASLIWIMLGEPIIGLIEEGIAGMKHGLFTAFMETFEVVLMLLGNIPSFFRIMGLSLAHASLMFGFTILTEMLWKGPILAIAAILTYIAGNLLTAGLEAIIAFAHSLRLHFYEWFSKFYSGKGIPFNPVSIPSYVRISLTA
jgi:V/A-type H+-transporting ATPase subunit I